MNVIRGEFVRPGQEDWAAVCATGTMVSVHVLYSRPSSCPSDFASSELLDEKTFAEGLSLNAILSGHVESGFWSGVIMPIDRAKLMGYPPPPPPLMDHEAIEYAMWEKASSQVFYCRDGQWQEIGGAD